MVKRAFAACLFVALLAASPALHSLAARADAPAARLAVLSRGINITHWFRFVPNRDARAMAADLNGAALTDLRRAGFTYIRLAVGPEEVMDGDHIAPDKLNAIVEVVGRIEHAGLGAMIEAHPELIQHWDLGQNADARHKLFAFWQDLAPALRKMSSGLTFPELVNEPSIKDASQWDMLQSQLLRQVRSVLADDTIVLTGTDWSSINGLLKVKPVLDRNVVYSFHSYEPQLLALLGFWDPAINKQQLAAYLPFPAGIADRCKADISRITDPHTNATAQYWCSLHEDAASIKKNLARASIWGHQHDVSVALTEFGAAGELNAPARLAFFSAVRRSAEQLQIPWALWGLDDPLGLDQSPGGFTSINQLSPNVLHALGLGPRAQHASDRRQ